MKTLSHSIRCGQTPLVRIPATVTQTDNIYAKLEYHNEAHNIKMRAALAMVNAAETSGILRPNSGQTLIESSGGSMGVSLAAICAQRGYQLKLVLPDNYNMERIRMLPLFGAEVVLSDPTTGNDSHFRLARKLADAHPDYIYLDQLSNQANPDSHYFGTGSEIAEALPHVDYFICGIGSGGTISGAGRKLKESFPSCKVIGVQPAGCKVLAGYAVPHKIQGWAAGVLPSILDINIIDGMLDITYEASIELGVMLLHKTGYYSGISGCANLLAAKMLAAEVGKDKVIVTVIPDSGMIYTSHFLNFFNSGN
jgi:cysteine synthase